MKKSRVAVEKIGGTIDIAVSGMFEKFPDIIDRLKECRKVFIKVNAVYFHEHLHTSARLVESVIEYIRRIDAKKRIYLMENCSQGNFTRLCFATIGMDAVARKLRAHCLYLDEEKSLKVKMGEGATGLQVRFPQVLHQNLIVDREKNFYLNMPVLKAHCQTQMTAGIKNQMGLLYDRDKAKNHNYLLHQKLVDILKFIRPDFTIVDAQKVLARGPMPPARFVEDLLHEKDVIVGGEDVVAVDAVCAKILGHEPESIKHVALAAEQGLGAADPSEIEVVGELPPCERKIPWELKAHFPESLKIVTGRGGACYEGCLGHLEQIIELLVNEKSDPTDFTDLPLTIVTGRGFEPDQLEELHDPIILLGECACSELLETLREKYIRMESLNTCGRCDNILALVANNLGVDVFNLSPLSRLEIYRQFLTGRLHGLRYKIPR